jgi:hypothetical protein
MLRGNACAIGSSHRLHSGIGAYIPHPPLMSRQGMNVQDRSDRAFGISRFRRAANYEHIGAGVVEIDQDGRVLRANSIRAS